MAAEPVLKRRALRTSDGVRLSLLAATASGVTGAASTAPAERPTVVFLPGWCMPAGIFAANARALAPHADVVLIDPRGQGESELARSGYTIERRVADLKEVLETLPRAVLVAWSLGVLESLEYVHRHGENRLAALVLVDNSVGEPPPPKPGNFLARLRADRDGTTRGFVRGLFAAPPPAELVDKVERSALRLPLDDAIALLSYPVPREHWQRTVRGVRVPLAYLVTDRFAEQAASLARARPATRVERFPGAGHALFVDAAARFDAILLDIVRAASAR